MKKIKINWESVGIWAYLICFWSAVIILVGIVLTSCVTTKQMRDYVRSMQSDSTKTTIIYQQQYTNTEATIDSLLKLRWQQDSLHQSSKEQETEQIRETVTTLFDSLGRATQRIEERLSNKQRDSKTDTWKQTWMQEQEQQWSDRFARQDSLLNALQERIETHWNNSTHEATVKETATKTVLPWYKRWWYTLQSHLLLFTVCAFLLLTRRIWWPWCKILFRKIWRSK